MKTFRTLGFILLTTAVILTGCAKSYKEGTRTAASIEDVELEAIAVKEQVNSTISALADMYDSQGNLNKQFKTYSKAIDALEAQAKRTRKQITTMKSRKADYLKRWDEQMATISNPTLRQTAEQRRKSVEEMFTNVQKEMEAAGEVFDPFLDKLKDIRTAMNMDLNSSGLEAIRPIAENAQEDGDLINTKLEAAIAELSKVIKALSGSVE